MRTISVSRDITIRYTGENWRWDKDYIFAAICEELGAIFAICKLLVCMSCYLMIVNVSMLMS